MRIFYPCRFKIPRLTNQFSNYIDAITGEKCMSLFPTAVLCVCRCELNNEKINKDKDDQLSCVNENEHNNNIKENNEKCK